MVPNVLAGFITGLGLIVAIGAQNVFVLRQGLRRNFVMAVALTATLTDAALISLGVGGVGSAIASQEWLATTAALGGAGFLLVYGVLSLRSAIRGDSPDWQQGDPVEGSAWQAVGATLAVSLLNPHVYLDTVVLLGGIGAQLPPEGRLGFTLGAVAASTAWFFSLAFGARALAPLLRHRLVGRLLDAFVAAVMFTVAAFLLVDLV